MTDGDKGIGFWKETYGFDFVAFVPGKDGATDDYACEDYCLREEFGDFAQKCEEKNGLFKCCKMSLRLDNYEASKVKKCNKHFNDGSNCFICTATRVCTYKVQFYHDLLASYYLTLLIKHPIWKGQVYRKTSR